MINLATLLGTGMGPRSRVFGLCSWRGVLGFLGDRLPAIRFLVGHGVFHFVSAPVTELFVIGPGSRMRGAFFESSTGAAQRSRGRGSRRSRSRYTRAKSMAIGQHGQELGDKRE